MKNFKKIELSVDPHYHAPNGAEIRELVKGNRGNSAHATIPPGVITKAIKHKTVEELWYCLEGNAKLWRKLSDYDEIIDFRFGDSIIIPTGCQFQINNSGNVPLKILITAVPPWPGRDEAIFVEGYWKTNEIAY